METSSHPPCELRIIAPANVLIYPAQKQKVLSLTLSVANHHLALALCRPIGSRRIAVQDRAGGIPKPASHEPFVNHQALHFTKLGRTSCMLQVGMRLFSQYYSRPLGMTAAKPFSVSDTLFIPVVNDAQLDHGRCRLVTKARKICTCILYRV